MPLLGGVRPPVAVLLCLLLAVALLTALVLARTDAQDVAPAVLTSQQHIAEDSAAELRGTVDGEVLALRNAAGALAKSAPATSAQALKRIGQLGQDWLGVEMLDPTSGNKLLAVTGAALPTTGLPTASGSGPIRPQVATLPSGQVGLLVFASANLPGMGQRLLVAAAPLTAADPGNATGRVVELVNRKGTVVASSAGPAAPASAAATPAPSAKPGASTAPSASASADPAATAADQRLPGDAAGAARRAVHGTSSGYLVGGVQDKTRTVAGWSMLATSTVSPDAASLGLTVLTVTATPQTGNVTGNSLFALLAAASLLVAALLVTALLTLGLQRPLLRLHFGGRRIFRGDLSRPVAVPRLGEAARIGAALESLRRQLLDDAPAEPFTPRRRGPGSRALLICCALILVSWSVPLLLLFNRPAADVAVPKQLVSDQQTRTAAIAGQVKQSLDSSYQDLTGLATGLTTTSTAAQTRSLLKAALAQHSRYTSLYVLTQDGSILARVGGKPRRAARSVPAGAGLLQINTTGRVPEVAAYVTVPKPVPVALVGQNPKDVKAPPITAKSPVAVVGEYDLKPLNSMLNHIGIGHAWLVDGRQRVVASRDGFRAFQSLPDGSLTDLAGKSSAQPLTSMVTTTDGDTIASVTALGVGGTTGATTSAGIAPATGADARSLGWQIVTAQPTSWLDLGAYRTQRLTMLAGLLGLAAAAGCLGWLYVIVVRPLRTLADTAEQLAAGDRRTVLYPVHHDEIGSITRSLELVRQQLVSSTRPTSPAQRV
ncbi:HAMP domain-containing protein [Streptacidiphilus sp. P02-A3a]|uniref:HAMP domain-containing protein n=1 Tax=Streptacidiphilus sp. P02-A3a TaxID=2704468 RepID=UPI0015FC3A97|nr:HAMP domain-containing protein [Streptacidiphilus sp. P02-A3a]QMU67807.1 HAMP domain-containing protein [Streptacidiphilus sp. P02-A3a]